MVILNIPSRQAIGVSERRQLNIKNPLFKMFLDGLRGMYQIKYSKPYNYYSYIFTALASLFITHYILKMKKNQFDQRKKPNFLIPSYIYKVRRQHFIYWQQSRLAHGLSTMFTYYDWDPQTNKMYSFDREGNSNVVEMHNVIENKQDMAAVFLEKHYPAPAQLHHQIVMYARNINNPYDLDNHLHHKSVNIGDWIRAGYYAGYKELGLSNRFRHDQYISKPEGYYDLEKVKLAYRISKDRDQLFKYIDKMKWSWDSVKRYFVWFI